MCEVNEEFIEIVDGFFHQNPGTSLNSLAKKSGVSEASLRRLLKRQINSPAKIPLLLNTLGYIKQEKSIGPLTEKVGGNLGKYLKKVTGEYDLSEAQLEQKVKIKDLKSNPYHLLILSLAMTERGVTEKEIEDLFGTEGLHSLVLLFEKNLLSLEKGSFYSRENTYMEGEEVFKENLNILLKNFSYDVDLTLAGLNKMGFKKLERLNLEYFIKRKKLLNTPKYKGARKVFLFSGQGEFDRSF